MLDNLTKRFDSILKNLRGQGKISEQNISDALRDVRRALLEADVNLSVVKEFIEKIRLKAVGEKVLDSLTPGQQFIKIVQDELTSLMGEEAAHLNVVSGRQNVLMMVGLQGSGKTTTTAKLAYRIKKQGRRPLLVAADIYRPGAIAQLETLGRQLNIPVFSLGVDEKPQTIVQKGLEKAKTDSHDVVILDTAGRLHIDDTLMEELREIKAISDPAEILLVVDAMMGQDAVRVAEGFNSALDISGVVLTKLDGDSRGGAALSVRAVTGKPIKFVGIGEKTEDLEPFHPDRLASRILGMGDILSLVEKAQEQVDLAEAEKLQKKIKSNQFTLEDFLNQYKQIKKMGPMGQVMNMIPGLGGKVSDEDMSKAEKQMKKMEAIIQSMTRKERVHPQVINSSRKVRIAKGSGTAVQDVNLVLKQFEQMQQFFKQFNSPSARKMLGKLQGGPSGRPKR